MDISKLLSESWSKFSANLVQAIILYLVGGIVGSLLAGLTLGIAGVPVFAGMYKAFRKIQQGGIADFSDLFSEFSNFAKWFMLWLLMLVVGLVSGITFGLAGIAAAFLLFFLIPLMIDKDMAAFDAAKESLNKVKDNFGTLFVPILVVILVAGAGSIAFYIGIIVTAPWMMVATWMLYDHAYGAAE